MKEGLLTILKAILLKYLRMDPLPLISRHIMIFWLKRTV